jgi:DNA-binding beta-propeller fold protein YncE
MMPKNSTAYRFALMCVGLGACGSDATLIVAENSSRSSTIQISEDHLRIAMVNPDDGTLSVFQTEDNSLLARVATGTLPSSVVLSADGKTAFVANRGDGTVVRVRNINSDSPSIDATVTVGSEPVGLALSPTGSRLFVAELAESRISVIDAGAMRVTGSLAVDRPRALLITNNGDDSDGDETLAVTQFYGTPVPGREARDDGRTGVIKLFSVGALTEQGQITLAPVDTGFHEGGDDANPTVTASPNQLASLATANGRLYVTSVAAAPGGVTRFDNNVFPVVYVADLASASEVTDASGTVNLARKVYDAIPTPSPDAPRFVPGDLSDIEFIPNSNVAYAVGRAGDVMLRITFGSTVEIGSTQNTEIDLAGSDAIGKCQAPIGVAIDKDRNTAYVNCWITRRLGIIDLDAQAMISTVESAPAPADELAQSQLRGARFYFTGRGRWSAAVANGAKGGEGWSSCGSCHADGLTDNLTWVFGSGPRQTTSMDGSFSHTAGVAEQKQRMFNWSAINDELHDFERNTRDVSGGLGAITTAANVADCDQLDKETPVALTVANVAIGGVELPLKVLADDAVRAACGHKDWDDIDAFVRTIAPPRALQASAAGAVERGRELFQDGGCAKCHGGAGWTVSRRSFTPSAQVNAELAVAPFVRPAFFPQTWIYNNGGSARTQLSVQPPIAADATGPAEPAAIALGQAACVLRNVGTFGLPDDVEGTNALELRPNNGALVRASGRAGYNVPSLYGLALGAPYLHHGQATSLADLLTDNRWRFHTNAANANFSVALGEPGALDDLIAFLHSLDAEAVELEIPNDPASSISFDACPK